jgi:hypothetical protein
VAFSPSSPLTANRPVSPAKDVASRRRLLDPAIRKEAPKSRPAIKIGNVSWPVTARMPSVASVSDRSTQSVIRSVRGDTLIRPSPIANARIVERTNGAASTSPMAMAFGTLPWIERV